MELSDCCTDLLMDGCKRTIENQLVHCDQCDGWIFDLKKEPVPGGNLPDESLDVNGFLFVSHEIHPMSSLSSCSNSSRRTIANLCFETRKNSSSLMASSNVSRCSSMWRTSSPKVCGFRSRITTVPTSLEAYSSAIWNSSNVFPSLVTSPKYSLSQTTTFFCEVVCARRAKPFRVSLMACPPVTTE